MAESASAKRRSGLAIEVRPRREHAMIVCRRGPYLAKAAFGHQALVAHSIPEGASDSAGLGSPIEYSADHFHFAGPGITMFAHVAVEAQRPIVPSLAHALLLQKVNGKNRRMAAVTAAKRERSIFQIGERRNGPPVTATILVIQPRSVSRIAIARQAWPLHSSACK